MTFQQWFAKRYPTLRESMEFGMLGGNELWLYEAVKEAWEQAQLNMEPDHGQLGSEQVDT